MPKPSPIPKYRLHKGSGQAIVQIKGRRTYLGKYDSDESRERYGRIVAELTANPHRAPAALQCSPRGDPMAVVQLCAAYWDYAQTYYIKDGKPTGHIYNVKRALQVLRQHYGTTPVDEFGPLALRAIQEQLILSGKARPYVNSLCQTIRRVFKWGVSREMVPAHVYQALATVPGLKRGRCAAREPAPIMPVDDQVVDATLSYLPPIIVDMVRFQRLTGCRPGEVCSLRPGDIDRNGEVWSYRPPAHKTAHLGRERIVWIGPQAQDVLLPYLLRAPDAYCFSPAESVAKRLVEMRERRKTRVQPSQVNRRKSRPKTKPRDSYQKDGYARAVARAVVLANRERPADEQIPHWHPNQLRHSVATRVRREFGLEAAQTVLGHARADVTQVYAERDGKLAADIMRRIG